MDIDTWFDNLWRDYVAMTPRVSDIRRLLEERGETVENDHVAFRTLDLEPIGIEQLGPLVESLGYQALDTYEFPAKRVQAVAYVREGYPRVFLSELRTGDFPAHRELFESLVDQIVPAAVTTPDVFWAGTLWDPVDHDTYLDLRETSEYGSWVTALGLRPNHFTVSVNALEGFDGIRPLLDFVEESGYRLNESGGRVKGSPDVYLEQGSTLADSIEIEFADGPHAIPTCYYEFALRYPTPDGDLYDGFVAASADRIFESTHSTSTS